VNEELRDHLIGAGYESVSARIIGNARLRRRRGGVRPWPSVRRDIVNHLNEDPGCIATTMVDYYGLPQLGDSAWPGRATAASRPRVHQKASCVQDALLMDVAGIMGTGFDIRRFVPFVVMHEFEGLLFSDCAAFARGIGRENLASDFQIIRAGFQTPEDINDSSEASPSHRVEQLVSGYQKPLLGTLAVFEIGVGRIREECPHFRAWIEKLESLVR
jgi:hypothetical protein